MIAYQIVFTLGVMGLLAGLYLALWTVLKDLKWLKSVLIPWMHSIGQAVNPDKK